MIVRDSKGNELLEIIQVEEELAAQQYRPVNHSLAVVKVGDDYLLGWNKWRKNWEIFGGCKEEKETIRECIIRECYEELGLENVNIHILGLCILKWLPVILIRNGMRNMEDYMELQYLMKC